MTEPKFVKTLKTKWKIKNNWDFILIMLVFSLAGSAIVFIRPLIFQLFGITAETATWIKVVTYILSIFPIYQFNLLFFGLFLGQFSFFWNKEKQLANLLFSSLVKK